MVGKKRGRLVVCSKVIREASNKFILKIREVLFMRLFFIFCVLIFANVAIASENKIYQMDLFSIISFGLTIAAFVLSIFMAWLSWKFYVKSADDSKATQSSVVKIETAVLGVQSSITEIVRQAVGYWTADPSIAQGSEIKEKIDEFSGLIKNLPDGTDSNKVQKMLNEIIHLVQEQNNASLVEARAKAIFPSINTNSIDQQVSPVVQFSQKIISHTESEATGELIIEVLRRSENATITGKFKPAFKEIPKQFSASLTSMPDGVNKDGILVTYGIGKVFDFNVHLKSKSGTLPLGEYVVEYKARQ